ncbi:GDNF family receptor alpha-like [Oncorhynchus nerka]|uniref:GDNF family receptor alpha-like n=1 Tax=Oncorhynchus kisutch TaxID=8019 RepID=A0A8C7LE88_ONCKI|nr:GDNF family receptor alpha-like [Oncorhynchus kisutch]XP_029541280.1 GDNF family receptor alpha-like [Oncorhynchus nerka]
MQRTTGVKTATVIVVLVYQMTSIKISSRSTGCFAFMEACISESAFCEKSSLRNICHPKDGSCQIKVSKVCNMTIHSILDQYPTVRGCLCAWEEPCTSLELLTSQCLPETDGQALSSSVRPRWNPMKEQPITTRDSCLSALHSCQKSHHCALVYKKLKDSCQKGKKQCNSPSSQRHCLSLWMELQSTSLSNCTCALSRRKCQGIWSVVNNNSCIQNALEALASTGLHDLKDRSNTRKKLTVHIAQQKKSSTVDWKSSSLKEYVHDIDGSCLQQMTICLHDDVCNRQMVPLVQTCLAKQCNSTHCRQVTQQLYAGLPYNIAEMFVLCECDPGDPDCLHMKEGLHSGTCGEHLEEARTQICLEIFDNCLGEALCRNRLEALLSNCWDTEDTPCSDFAMDECTSLLDPALILGGDAKCRMALIATMGTTLQHPCTCGGLHSKDLYKCNMMREVLHNRTHFMSPVKKESTPYVPPPMTESESGYEWLSDQLLNVFAYILLVAVVLLGVMIVFHIRKHKGNKKPQFHPPDKNCVVIF